MKTFWVELELLEPVLVPRPASDPNSVETLPYLPGSALLGAMAGRYIAQQCGGETARFDAADSTVRRLFFDGDTRYLNAYPAAALRPGEALQRFWPTPRSLRKAKSALGEDSALSADTHNVEYFDHALESPPGDSDEQWKSAGAPFCWWPEPDNGGEQEYDEEDEEDDYYDDGTGDQDARLYLLPVEQRINVHNARSRRAGRAVTDATGRLHSNDFAGTIFRYRALAAGQTMIAVILCEEQDEATIRQLLAGNGNGENRFNLGKSSQATYGSVKICSVEAKGDWRECGGAPPAIAARSEFTITLMSDAILRHNGGAVVEAEALQSVLETAWESGGVRLELVREKSFVGGALAGGFNRKWNLPLPQLPALAMGSVLTFKLAAGAVSADQVAQLETSGIGARRSEGFGRLAVDLQREEKYQVARIEREAAQPVTLDQDSDAEKESYALARHLAGALFRAKMESRLQSNTHDLPVIKRAPRNAQLQRLRMVIARQLAQPQPSCAAVRDFLVNIGQRATSRNQFESAVLENNNLKDWIEQLLPEADDDRMVVWRSRFSVEEEQQSIGGAAPLLTQGLCDEYLLRLLDAILERAIKKNRSYQSEDES